MAHRWTKQQIVEEFASGWTMERCALVHQLPRLKIEAIIRQFMKDFDRAVTGR